MFILGLVQLLINDLKHRSSIYNSHLLGLQFGANDLLRSTCRCVYVLRLRTNPPCIFEDIFEAYLFYLKVFNIYIVTLKPSR